MVCTELGCSSIQYCNLGQVYFLSINMSTCSAWYHQKVRLLFVLWFSRALGVCWS